MTSMTEYRTLSNSELLDRVDRAGSTLPPALIRTLLARRIELSNEILARFAEAIQDDWDDDDDPRWYRAVHYGFLLIAYRERKALPIFATIYSAVESYDALLEWFEVAPAHFGPPAAPVFQEVLRNFQDSSSPEWHYGAALSVAILKTIAIRYPATRHEIVTFLRSFLPPLDANGRLVLNDEEDVNPLWGSFINALAELRDRESMPQVLAMFDADLIDPMEIDREAYLEDLEQAPSTARAQPFDLYAVYAQ